MPGIRAGRLGLRPTLCLRLALDHDVLPRHHHRTCASLYCVSASYSCSKFRLEPRGRTERKTQINTKGPRQALGQERLKDATTDQIYSDKQVRSLDLLRTLNKAREERGANVEAWPVWIAIEKIHGTDDACSITSSPPRYEVLYQGEWCWCSTVVGPVGDNVLSSISRVTKSRE